MTKKALAIVGAVVLTVGLAIGGYQLGWWIKADSTNRTTAIANDSLARQQALLDEASDTAGDIAAIDVQLTQVSGDQAQAIAAQRVALVDKFCDAYAGLTGRLQTSQTIESLAIKECN